jgi:hypothetical protein
MRAVPTKKAALLQRAACSTQQGLYLLHRCTHPHACVRLVVFYGFVFALANDTTEFPSVIDRWIIFRVAVVVGSHRGEKGVNRNSD